jgi:glycolate oxidase iron-sulfur subunit
VQTQLADFIRDTPEGQEAAEILGKCVHCGFCTATCPTYQLLGDELDGPRGRIYLIKQVLEGVRPSEKTQLHLDRCLTCRNCETTCPSGVQYARLLDIGRKVVEDQVPRPLAARAVRAALKSGLTSPLFGPAMKLGQLARPLLPAALKAKVPAPQSAGGLPRRSHPRRMLLLAGCVQPAMAPNINAATMRVFDALGITLEVPAAAGCCGAIRYHLNDHDGGLRDARANIDAWWPHLEAGCEAIVINASGCGAQVKEYGHLLRHDPVYAAKAQRVSELTKDVAELLVPMAEAIRDRLLGPAAAARGVATATHPAAIAPDGPATMSRDPEAATQGTAAAIHNPAWAAAAAAGSRSAPPRASRVVFHSPCTLQHGQQVRGEVERLLAALGADVLPVGESHFCCGSAGTYSVLQPQLATQLRDRRLSHLEAPAPEVILSANIGCIAHLQSGTERRVAHWIEWLDERLGAAT